MPEQLVAQTPGALAVVADRVRQPARGLFQLGPGRAGARRCGRCAVPVAARRAAAPAAPARRAARDRSCSHAALLVGELPPQIVGAGARGRQLALQIRQQPRRRRRPARLRLRRPAFVLEPQQLAFQLGEPRAPAAVRLLEILRRPAQRRRVGRRGRRARLRRLQRVLQLGHQRRLLGHRRLQLGHLVDVRRRRLVKLVERALAHRARRGQLLGGRRVQARRVRAAVADACGSPRAPRGRSRRVSLSSSSASRQTRSCFSLSSLAMRSSRAAIAHVALFQPARVDSRRARLLLELRRVAPGARELAVGEAQPLERVLQRRLPLPRRAAHLFQPLLGRRDARAPPRPAARDNARPRRARRAAPPTRAPRCRRAARSTDARPAPPSRPPSCASG